MEGRNFFLVTNKRLQEYLPLSFTVVFMSIVVTFFIHSILFAYSDKIWGIYPHIDPALLAPAIRRWVIEHDGIEAYVLYFLSFVSMLGTFSLSFLLNFTRKSPQWHNCFCFLGCLVALAFFYTVGFNPPTPDIAVGINLVIAFIEVSFLFALILSTAWLPKVWSYFALMIILVPVCFIAKQGIGLFDYSFIFFPAYKILNHFKLTEIYSQYDLLLPFLAAVWMKLGLDLNDFQIIPRLSIYLFLLGVFIYSRRLFLYKPLAYILLFSIILIKLYASPSLDLVTTIQLTPLRLDLWLVLLIIATERGIYSKWLGGCLGVMLIVHHSFTLFYVAGYLELWFAVLLLDYIDQSSNKGKSLTSILKKHLFQIAPNFLLICLGMLIYYHLFKHIIPESVSLYKDLGVGFLRVTRFSFYWYILVLLGATSALLMQQRNKLTQRYFRSGLFLLLLVVANSLYFLGRSHESLIIYLQGSFVLMFFLFIDLLNRRLYFLKKTLGTQCKKWLLNSLPVFFILVTTYFYSERIVTSVQIQTRNLMNGDLEYSISQEILPASKLSKEQFAKKLFNIDKLMAITNHSDKIYVLSYYNDFYYYYYGGYQPQGYFLPYFSWPFKEELSLFLQSLLNDGFYLVIPQTNSYDGVYSPLRDWEVQLHQEMLSSLSYRHHLASKEFKIVWK